MLANYFGVRNNEQGLALTMKPGQGCLSTSRSSTISTVLVFWHRVAQDSTGKDGYGDQNGRLIEEDPGIPPQDFIACCPDRQGAELRIGIAPSNCYATLVMTITEIIESICPGNGTLCAYPDLCNKAISTLLKFWEIIYEHCKQGSDRCIGPG